jgi:type VI secretion system protein ImpE
MDAQQYLSEGNLEQALLQLQEQIRNDPAKVTHRVFLFQLLAVMGQWDRALTQLNLIGELDASALAMVQTYREAILCEGLRAEIFAGKRTPVVFGQPEQWIALLIEALRLTAEGQYARSQEVRNEAFELAPATSGTIGEQQQQSFNWIADADSRLGPVLEVIINGRYFWVPFHRIRSINIIAPEDMRDQVWMPAWFTWANGGETAALIPTRYSGSGDSEDNQIRSAHKTIWQELGENLYQGLGQRMLVTDADEYSLMDLRLVNLDTQEEITETPKGKRTQQDSPVHESTTADV